MTGKITKTVSRPITEDNRRITNDRFKILKASDTKTHGKQSDGALTILECLDENTKVGPLTIEPGSQLMQSPETFSEPAVTLLLVSRVQRIA